MGLLKTGRKTLFLRDGSNSYCSQQPLCILDFFVLPQNQRQGVGRALFEVTCLFTAAVALNEQPPTCETPVLS